MAALVDLVEVDELVIRALGPAAWRTIDLARKHRHRNRDRDVRCLLLHSVKIVVVILPVEPRGRGFGVGERITPREILPKSKILYPLLVTPCVVCSKISRGVLPKEESPGLIPLAPSGKISHGARGGGWCGQDSSYREEEADYRCRREPISGYNSGGYDKARESSPRARFLMTQCA